MATLAAARRIAADLRAGLTGPGVTAAAGRLRALLGVTAVGLGGLDGEPAWSGPVPGVAAQLVERVRERDARATHDGVAALPVHVRDGLAGVLVIDGDAPGAASREAAAWVGEALEGAQLEASAEVAEQAELRAPAGSRRVDFHWFPLENPGIVSIPPSFLLGYLGTVLSKEKADPALWAMMEVRSLTGVGAARATAH